MTTSRMRGMYSPSVPPLLLSSSWRISLQLSILRSPSRVPFLRIHRAFEAHL